MQHCSKCDGQITCAGFHVYVIELDPKVLDEERFHPDREGLEDNPRCFYVGQTKHHPTCRHTQHRRKLSGKNVTCNCFGKSKKLALTGFNKGNHYVRKYGMKGGLRPEFYLSRNPFDSREESKKIERELAEELTERGYAVHWN